MAKNWVWRSTKQSIADQQLSIAACAEIVWSVLLYWLIWYWFDTHWHLLSSLFAAPLLLLRSPQSIEQGKAWFLPKQEIKLKSALGVSVLLLTGLVFFALCYGLASWWLPEYSGFALFWRAAVIGFIGVAVVIVGFGHDADTDINSVSITDINTSAFAFAVVVTPFFVLAIWFVSIVIRFCATVKYIGAGIGCFGQNWHASMFVVDLWHQPSLMPGDDTFSVSYLVERLKDDNKTDRFFAAILLPIIYIPALLYRWSIKSTMWFYWPLLYVRSGKFTKVADKVAFNLQILKNPVEQLRIVFALITIVTMLWVTFILADAMVIHGKNPAMIFPYLLAIDVTAIKPWQWFQLATAVITIILWAMAWRYSINAEGYEKVGDAYDWSKVEWLRKLARVRNLTTWCYLAIGLVFTGLWLGGYNYISQDWQVWFTNFFGTEFATDFASAEAAKT